jgi:hypothetical protein
MLSVSIYVTMQRVRKISHNVSISLEIGQNPVGW